MVARDWLKDSDSISQAFKGLKQPPGIGKKVWLVSFLEGTRMTPEKLEKVNSYSYSSFFHSGAKKKKKITWNYV